MGIVVFCFFIGRIAEVGFWGWVDFVFFMGCGGGGDWNVFIRMWFFKRREI